MTEYVLSLVIASGITFVLGFWLGRVTKTVEKVESVIGQVAQVVEVVEQTVHKLEGNSHGHDKGPGPSHL